MTSSPIRGLGRTTPYQDINKISVTTNIIKSRFNITTTLYGGSYRITPLHLYLYRSPSLPSWDRLETNWKLHHPSSPRPPSPLLITSNNLVLPTETKLHPIQPLIKGPKVERTSLVSSVYFQFKCKLFPNYYWHQLSKIGDWQNNCRLLKYNRNYELGFPCYIYYMRGFVFCYGHKIQHIVVLSEARE